MFTGTINITLNTIQTLTTSILLNLQNFKTIVFNGTMHNAGAGYYQEWLPWQQIVTNLSTKYIKSVSVSYNGYFDDASIIRINNYYYQRNWFNYCGGDNYGWQSISFTISDENSLSLLKSNPNNINVRVGGKDMCGGEIHMENAHFFLTIYFE